MNKKRICATVLVCSMILSGCGTMELQTQSKLTKSVIIDHSKNEQKTIYVQVHNTAGSGGENMKLQESIVKRLQDKGYTIVSKSNEATYGLFVNVLFANSLKEANALAGAQLGLQAGIVAAATKANSLQEAAALAVGVAAATAITSAGLADETFRAIIDVEIRDYSNGGTINTVRSEVVTDAKPQSVARSGDRHAFAGSFGLKEGSADMQSGIEETTSQQFDTNYVSYKTRVFSEAVKMKLNLAEAMPILEDKSAHRIAEIF